MLVGIGVGGNGALPPLGGAGGRLRSAPVWAKPVLQLTGEGRHGLVGRFGLEATSSFLGRVLIPESVTYTDALSFAASHVRISPVGNRQALMSSTGQLLSLKRFRAEMTIDRSEQHLNCS